MSKISERTRKRFLKDIALNPYDRELMPRRALVLIILRGKLRIIVSQQKGIILIEMRGHHSKPTKKLNKMLISFSRMVGVLESKIVSLAKY